MPWYTVVCVVTHDAIKTLVVWLDYMLVSLYVANTVIEDIMSIIGSQYYIVIKFPWLGSNIGTESMAR